MIATSADFAAMADSQDQTPCVRVQMTLPGGVYPDLTVTVRSLTLDASTTTDLPQQARTQEGYGAASAEFVLSGLVDAADESKTVAWLFGRYSTSSPLYRQDAFRSLVTVDLGYYTATCQGVPEWVRKFTGYVDQYTETPDGGVRFVCIDQRTVLRNLPFLPPVIQDPKSEFTMTSAFAVDLILRNSAAAPLSWPPARPRTAARPKGVCAAGFRDSLLPEVGSVESSGSTTVAPPTGAFLDQVFAAGAWGSSALTATRAGAVSYVCADNGRNLSSSASPYIEFWATQRSGGSVIFGNGTASIGSMAAWKVQLTPGQISVSVGRSDVTLGYIWWDTYTTTVATDSASHYLGVAFSWPWVSTSWSATIYYDSTVITTGTRSAGHARVFDAFIGSNVITVGVAPTGSGDTIEAVQVSDEAAPVSNGGFVPTAVIEPSLNPLKMIPALEGDAWAVLQRIAAAEAGVCLFDETGVFRFKNRNTLAAVAPTRTITSTTALKNLQIDSAAAAVLNRARISYTEWKFEGPGVVYSPIVPIHVPRRSNKQFEITLDTPVFRIDDGGGSLPVIMDGAYTGTLTSGWRGSIDAAGTAKYTGAIVYLKLTTPTTVRVSIFNQGSQDIWFVSSAEYLDLPAGTPAFRIVGSLATPNSDNMVDFQWPPAEAGGAAASASGEILYEQPGNQWIQDDDTAMNLGRDLVVASCVPIPNLTNVDIVPDFRLQLTDCVRVVDTHRTGVDEYGRIFGWNLSWQAPEAPGGQPSWSMTVDARLFAAPGGWLLGVPGRSEIGTTAYVYA